MFICVSTIPQHMGCGRPKGPQVSPEFLASLPLGLPRWGGTGSGCDDTTTGASAKFRQFRGCFVPHFCHLLFPFVPQKNSFWASNSVWFSVFFGRFRRISRDLCTVPGGFGRGACGGGWKGSLVTAESDWVGSSGLVPAPWQLHVPIWHLRITEATVMSYHTLHDLYRMFGLGMDSSRLLAVAIPC